MQFTQFSIESQKTNTFFLLLCTFTGLEPMFLPTQLWFQPTSVCRKVLTRELEARNGKLLKIKGGKAYPCEKSVPRVRSTRSLLPLTYYTFPYRGDRKNRWIEKWEGADWLANRRTINKQSSRASMEIIRASQFELKELFIKEFSLCYRPNWQRILESLNSVRFIILIFFCILKRYFEDEVYIFITSSRF